MFCLFTTKLFLYCCYFFLFFIILFTFYIDFVVSFFSCFLFWFYFLSLSWSGYFSFWLSCSLLLNTSTNTRVYFLGLSFNFTLLWLNSSGILSFSFWFNLTLFNTGLLISSRNLHSFRVTFSLSTNNNILLIIISSHRLSSISRSS